MSKEVKVKVRYSENTNIIIVYKDGEKVADIFPEEEMRYTCRQIARMLRALGLDVETEETEDD